jgi:cadmium resistance protein CadD (predicted permease)
LPSDEFTGDLSSYDSTCDFSAEETDSATGFLITALLGVFLAMMFLSMFSEQISQNPTFKEMLPKVQRVLVAITIALIALTLLSLAV